MCGNGNEVRFSRELDEDSGAKEDGDGRMARSELVDRICDSAIEITEQPEVEIAARKGE